MTVLTSCPINAATQATGNTGRAAVVLWFLMRLLRDYEPGLVAIVKAIVEADLHSFGWYRPQLNRSGVVALLLGKPPGSFCVRKCSAQPGCYALSVSVSARASKLWTGLITPTYDGKGKRRYRLFVKQKFDTIPMLVAYYHDKACVTIDRGSRKVKLVGHV